LKEQAALRLQAEGRGFLARRMVRKIRMLISSSLHQLAACATAAFASPAEVEFWVCSPPARPKMVVSFILAPALMLGRPIIRSGWYLLHRSSNMTSAVQLFPWDPGGQENIAAIQIYILVSSLFSILVFNNRGKPRCKRLNPRSRHISLRQLFSSRTSWVSESGGDVMGMQRGAAVGRECPSWALSPLVLISVSLSYLSIGIVPYCLGTRGVSPMYPL
jgi:hypothetical protein